MNQEQTPRFTKADTQVGTAAVDDAALLTDLYQLTMLQAYVAEGMTDTAVFELFVRNLPAKRNYLIACGMEDVLDYLEGLHFSPGALEYLDSLGSFRSEFLDYLADFSFTGKLRAVPEGTVVFPLQPLLEVTAPLPEAQLVESFILNQVHLQTMVASKAVRVVTAAAGRTVVDFGLRRYHGKDAAMKAARAAYIAGVGATSNVLAGRCYGIPVTGTMAHSYIMAHRDESEAFSRFTALYPDTVLLVDTYDVLIGVRRMVRLAEQLGSDFQVRAIRLDSGDLIQLSRESRKILDRAGLTQVGIFASGDLDEYRIAELIAGGAPIAGFGVGTRMGISADAPFLNCAYKLVSYGGRPCMKLSSKKATLPGRKQVYRFMEDGRATGDVIALDDEAVGGRALLHRMMQDGNRLKDTTPDLVAIRDYCREERESLPSELLDLEPVENPYPVEISTGIIAERDHLLRVLTRDG